MTTSFAIIPVLDLQGGLAVHAKGGDRLAYRPVEGALGNGRAPAELALAMAKTVRSTEVYVADLDAITNRGDNAEVIAAIRSQGLRPMVDLGFRHGNEPLLRIMEFDPILIAATETLQGERTLTILVERFGVEHLVFSLDLREGRPILSERPSWPDVSPIGLASRAVEAGLSRMILLDLNRVGGARGSTSGDLLGQIKRECPTLKILVGGGVSGIEDLQRLRDAGADGALVATALHSGGLLAKDVEIFQVGV